MGCSCIIVSDGVCLSVLYHTCEFYLGFGTDHDFLCPRISIEWASWHDLTASRTTIYNSIISIAQATLEYREGGNVSD